ncbi:histidine phosphatase family protein [Microlunatus panaciterrae]|uniref:Phosphohistidine phosphatase n=1 Tax=Microlunatus panaciterrae TaxID=400768 RepID=A0ABS2RLA7_9ACTN|nr:histidine phosphatase family protein [Microlunatus panaciterrae]MBM7799790.1 phosphohistidine phosphatase [Microlunatus panaciterrae]
MSDSAASKTIMLLRHAKSAWGLDVDDHERPLSGRGRRDSLAVGAFLADHDIRPDLVVCSTATRAQQTWRRAVKGGAPTCEVSYDDSIYEAWVPELMAVLRGLSEQVSTVLLVGHAPGIPDLVDKIGNRDGRPDLWRALDDKFPTSGLATLRYDGSWAGLSAGSATLVGFDVPRGAAKKRAKK